MLNNKHRYTLIIIKELIKGYSWWLLSFFIKKNKNIIILNSFLNNDFSDNTKEFFLYLINNEQDKEFYFIINNDQKRAELNQSYPGRFISNRKIKDIILILKSYYWLCSTLELPLAGFFYKKQRKVIHFGHGMPFKKIGFLEKNISWYKTLYLRLISTNFSYSIATSIEFKKIISDSFGLPIDEVKLLPQPKTAQLSLERQKKPDSLDNMNYNIIYAPTWRPYGNVIIFPFDDFDIEQFLSFIEKNNIYIWFRLHPEYEQSLSKELIKSNNIKIMSSKKYPDINEYMFSFDLLITDYSSVFFDYLITERPILFFNYDQKRYINEVGLIDNHKDFQKNKSILSMKEFLSKLNNLIQGKNSKYLDSVLLNKKINFPIQCENINQFIYERIFNEKK